VDRTGDVNFGYDFSTSGRALTIGAVTIGSSSKKIRTPATPDSSTAQPDTRTGCRPSQRLPECRSFRSIADSEPSAAAARQRVGRYRRH
jgi:hypothetical protein